MDVTTESGTPAKPVIRKIRTDDVYAALAEGWADFRAAPKFGLFFGGVYAVAGMIILLQLMVWEQPLWIIPLIFAFPLIGPFAAVGLYEVSRRREAGEALDWADITEVVWKERHGQLPSMAFVVLFLFMVWIWIAHLIFALFLGRIDSAMYSDIGAVLFTGSGFLMMIVGSVIGGAIASVLFAVTVISLPMLLDRELDFVTAMVASAKAVTTNLFPMLWWAWIVGASLIAGMVPFFFGLIIVLPVLGHATWHLYRKVIEPVAS